MHIVIGGNIGAGKSTIIDLLKDLLPQCIFIKERISVWNKDGILSDFYQDMDKWAVPLQDRIINDYCEVYSTMLQDKLYVYERSIWDSIVVFQSEHASQEQQDKWLQLAENWIPDMYILLETDPFVCHTRVISRCRKGEDIDIEYLMKLKKKQDKLTGMLITKGVTVKTVDGNSNSTEIVNYIAQIIKTVV